MTQISLSKTLSFFDEERGKFLKLRATFEKGSEQYKICSGMLRALNKMKKELSNLSDADQIPLGL